MRHISAIDDSRQTNFEPKMFALIGFVFGIEWFMVLAAYVCRQSAL